LFFIVLLVINQIPYGRTLSILPLFVISNIRKIF
jgi:hypothetical protein